MNMKILALSILAMIIISGYAAFYTYKSLYVILEDLKVFKELKSIKNVNIPEKDLKDWDTFANEIENGDNTAVTNDLRELAILGREMNT